MPAAILSQDILSICLFLSDGNIDLSIEEIIQRAEQFQEKNNRHFGITRSDFRGLFSYWFIFDLGIKQLDDEFDDIKLEDFIIDILTYHDAYFNDEGEYWTEEKVVVDEDQYLVDIEYLFGYDEIIFNQKVLIKSEMKFFFSSHGSTKLSSKVVQEFMKELEISEAILFHCSRRGESS